MDKSFDDFFTEIRWQRVKQILHIGKVSVRGCRGSLNLNSGLGIVPGSLFLTLFPKQFRPQRKSLARSPIRS